MQTYVNQEIKPAFYKEVEEDLDHLFNIRKDKIANGGEFRNAIFDGNFSSEIQEETGRKWTKERKTATSGEDEEVLERQEEENCLTWS